MPKFNGVAHIDFTVRDAERSAAWYERVHLDRCGVAHSGVSVMAYGSLVVFRDPDNIQLELFALSPAYRLAAADEPMSRHGPSSA